MSVCQARQVPVLLCKVRQPGYTHRQLLQQYIQSIAEEDQVGVIGNVAGRRPKMNYRCNGWACLSVNLISFSIASNPHSR